MNEGAKLLMDAVAGLRGKVEVAASKVDAVSDGTVFQAGANTFYYWLNGKKVGPFSSSEKAHKYAAEDIKKNSTKKGSVSVSILGSAKAGLIEI